MDSIDNISKPLNLKLVGVDVGSFNKVVRDKIKIIYNFINENNKRKGQMNRSFELHYNNMEIYLTFSMRSIKSNELYEKLWDVNEDSKTLFYNNIKPFFITTTYYDCKVIL